MFVISRRLWANINEKGLSRLPLCELLKACACIRLGVFINRPDGVMEDPPDRNQVQITLLTRHCSGGNYELTAISWKISRKITLLINRIKGSAFTVTIYHYCKSGLLKIHIVTTIPFHEESLICTKQKVYDASLNLRYPLLIPTKTLKA